MTTYTDLINKIRPMINERFQLENGGSMFLDEDIKGWIESSIIELCSDTMVNYELYEYEVPEEITQLSFDLIHGGTEDSIAQRLFSGYIESDKTDVMELEIVNALAKYRQKDVLTASITKNKFNFNRKVKPGSVIIVAGKWIPVIDGVNYPLNRMCEDATIQYCLRNGYLKREKAELAANFHGLFTDRKRKIEEISNKEVMESDQVLKGGQVSARPKYKGSIDPDA